MSSLWVVTVEVPMKLPSLANLRLHWAAKAKTVKAQRAAVALALRTQGRQWLTHWKGISANPAHRLGVCFTRLGPRALDDDNLAHAFKGIRDEVAAFVGLDDGDSRFVAEYHQQRGLYGVRIRLQVLEVERGVA